LEAAKKDREQSRARLVAASLQRLNAPADVAEAISPDAFRDHARFYFDHLPRLTTKLEHIKQLRQTILNLAVRGKLVPQDPNDEPVNEVLKRVTVERRNLIRNQRLSSTTEVEADLLLHPIPSSWKWMRLADLISFGPQNGISPKPTNDVGFPKALTLTATTSGFCDPKYYKHVALHRDDCQNYWLSVGDVLFQRGNTREYVGMAAVYDGPEKSFVFPDLMIRVRFAESLFLRFIHTTLISPLLRSYFSVKATGASSSMPKISQGVLLNAPIPLPPLSEQHRIVAKVDELVTLCDQLETQLDTTEADTRSLLEAILHEALAPPLEESA
jgi:type I restriction enzyme S subunit